jgi:hypothetical protein
MPFVLKFQSAIEQQLEGWGPSELVSITAELLVAAIFFLPVVGLFAMTSWWLKRSLRLRPHLQIHGAVGPTTLTPHEHSGQKKVA